MTQVHTPSPVACDFWSILRELACGRSPTRLKTAEELHARRLAYELDMPWYPDAGHKNLVKRVFENHTSTGGTVENVREFADASPERKRLIDPTWRAPGKL